MYCAKFVSILHTMETPGFCTLQYFDAFVNVIVGYLHCTTEDEAACVGILLKDTLKLISDLRYDKKLYGDRMEDKAWCMLG
mmetsp:Transcript_11884/g.16893  ORF Transcript_11884/g.16893 Transcript_11884/m.16893 type:complete len:81 (+) Transcript_11884:254-496(+)